MQPRRSLALLTCIFIASCATNPATGGYNFSLVTPQREREIGEASARAMLTSEGLYRPASATTQYVTNLCHKVYEVTEQAAKPLQCVVIDTDVFNAAATPGYMLINRGLLPFLSSEAELAAILGHESGHHTARHAVRSMTRDIIADTLANGALAATAYSTGSYSAVQAVSSTTSLATSLGLATYSRGQEAEADSLGIRYMQQAGYDPREAVNMQRGALLVQNYLHSQQTAFNNGEIAPVSLLDRLKSSHPATPERVAAALAKVGEPVVMSPEEDLGRQRYMAAIKGMAYGPARRYGIARKAELVLPQQRVVIPLPDATTTTYIGSGDYHSLGTWLIAHPQSGAYLAVSSLKVPAGSSPATQVQRLLPLLHGPVQQIQVGLAAPLAVVSETQPDATPPEEDTETSETDALDAAYVTPQTLGYTADFHYINSAKRYRLMAVSSPATVNEMLVFMLVYPDAATMAREDGNLVSIIKDIRFLTKRQSKKYKQLELFTFRAAVGDSVARQAAKLPAGALQEDLFRALNNLPAPQEMTPGKLYKTVVDLNN